MKNASRASSTIGGPINELDKLPPNIKHGFLCTDTR